MIVRAEDQLRMPWKNGGGVTSEVARAPAGSGDDFDWRISIAEVAAGGPFSSFPGIDRVIIRLGEAPLVLEVDGEEQALERFTPFAFSGEATTSASLPGGPTRDLNVMSRRGHATAAVAVERHARAARLVPGAGYGLAVVVLEGALEIDADGAAAVLGERDAVVGEPGEALQITGGGALIARIELRST